jgi:hypothetical protein
VGGATRGSHGTDELETALDARAEPAFASKGKVMHFDRALRVLAVAVMLGTWSGASAAQVRNGPPTKRQTSSPSSRPTTASPAASKACVEAFERGQGERLDHNFSAAREDLLTCSQQSCPPRIVAECIQLLEVLRQETPNIGLRVTDGSGQELFDVEVTMDDRLLTSRLDGTVFDLNPGVHKIQISANGYEPLTTTFSVHPSERGRIINVELKRFSDAAAPPEPALPPAPAGPEHSDTPDGGQSGSFRVPAATYLAGGVAVVALGGFGFFRATGASDYDRLIASCSPRCTDAQINPVRTKFVLSTVSLGVAGLALATGGITLLLSQPSKSPHATGTALHWAGSEAFLETRF